MVRARRPVTPQVLLIRRTWPGATPYWVLPGGHVEADDPSLRAALIREIREETGAEPLTPVALDAISLEPEPIAALLRGAVTSGPDLAALADQTRSTIHPALAPIG